MEERTCNDIGCNRDVNLSFVTTKQRIARLYSSSSLHLHSVDNSAE